MNAKRRLRYLLPILGLMMLPVLTPSTPSQIKQSPAASSSSPVPRASDEVVRLAANLVTVPTTVMDRDGRYISDLHEGDFQIFEDGVEQQVAFFAPVEQPFTILFLLDTSSSMLPYKANLAYAANALLRQLRPDDQLIAVSFFKSIEILFQAARVSELHKDIKLKVREDADCTTMIYDVVDEALKRMKKIKGRKAIVLFSDGIGSGYLATDKRNLRDAEEQEALIYTVQFGTFSAEPPRFVSRETYFKQVAEVNGYMQGLAQKTGGRHYQVENISNLSTTFGQVAEELRQQYSLGYYPKQRLEAGQQRQIKVKVRRPDLAVRARSSYLVGPDRKPRP